jgi:hypothetical protein
VLLDGILAFLHGDTLRSYEQYLGFAAICGFAGWVIIPALVEYRIRSKETYRIVREIKNQLDAPKTDAGSFGM